MLRTTVVGWLALLCVLGAGCGDDDDQGAAGAAGNAGGASGASGSSASNAGSGSTSTGGSGTGTSGASSGGAARGGSASGGRGGGATAGAGGATAEAGTGAGRCDLRCPDGQRCELVQVTCIQAPCNPVPECVAAGGGEAGSGSGGAVCGTRGARPCPDGQFCNHPISADCGRADAPGTCQPKPGACTFEFNPVCGCDGMTYPNKCAAASAGVSVDSEGECEQTNAGDLLDCDPRKAACDEEPGECPQGRVRAIDGACYGDCVAVERCACNGPAACPLPETFTCHMSAGHCGPYV